LVEIRPFKAIRFSEKAGAISNLITQPYDKIDPLMQKLYYEKSIYNYCRLILPIENNKYEVAKNRINDWINSGILIKDREPAIFVYRQEFQVNQKNFTRIGFIVALRLYHYEENVVFPHEVTYKEPKTDRINMLESVQKDLEPVFLIYSDPKKITINLFSRIINTSPLIDFIDSSRVSHSVWQIVDSQSIQLLMNALKNKKLVIADGHHRYESAINYRDAQQKKGKCTNLSACNFQMSYIVPIEEEGLVVLSTHRALKEFELTPKKLDLLNSFFNVEQIDPTVNSLNHYLRNNSKKHVFCVYDGTKAYGLILKNKKQLSKILKYDTSTKIDLLDVTILRDLVFKHVMRIGKMKMHKDILYVGSTTEALNKVDSGEAKLAFLVNPVDPKIVWKIAKQGSRLPEKSTDFYPKPCSGLMMMNLANGEQL